MSRFDEEHWQWEQLLPGTDKIFSDDSILGVFRNHPLTEVDISFRLHNPILSLKSLVRCSKKSLKRLVMIGCHLYNDFEAIQFFSNLRCLNLRDGVQLTDASLEKLANNLHYLAELDISFCSQLSSLTGLLCLKPTLRSLSVRGVPLGREGFSNILELTELRHLDISLHRFSFQPLEMREEAVEEVMENLSYLVSLDISFTTLSSNSVATLSQRAGFLEFLGLVGVRGLPSDLCMDSDCTVAGDCSIVQMCNGLERYCSLGSVVSYLLVKLHSTVCTMDLEDLKDSTRVHAFPILLEVLNSSWDLDDDSAADACAIMFYLLKDNHYECQDCALLHGTARFLVSCLKQAKHISKELNANCFIVMHQLMGNLETIEPFLCHFLEVSLECLQLQGAPTFHIISCCVYACQRLSFLAATEEIKALFRKTGAIQIFVEFIARKFALKQFDTIMESACSFLWNATDKCPENCQEFVEKQGLQLFLSFYEKSPDNLRILLKMLGLMGNVSVVPSLQMHFMTTEMMDTLKNCAESDQENCEISYHSTATLCNVITNRDLEWVAATPKEQVFDTIRCAVLRWKINSLDSFSYTSLLPLLKIAKCFDCPAAQLWAVWALFKICNSKRPEYCTMMEKEGGLPLLKEILATPTADTLVKRFAKEAQNLCLHMTSDN